MDTHRLKSGPQSRRILAAVSCGLVIAPWAARALAASEPLSIVPASSAAVLVFKNPDDMVAKTTALLGRLYPAYRSIPAETLAADFVDLEREFGLPPGTCDFSSQLVVLLPKPSLDASGLVLAFTPREPERFAKFAGRGSRWGRHIQHDGKSAYVTVRDGVGLVTKKRRAMQSVLAAPAEGFMPARLDARTRSMLQSDDAVLILPMEKWRPLARPYLRLLSTLFKVSVSSQQVAKADAEATRRMVDWFIVRAFRAMDQMEEMAIGLRLDESGVRLTHHHAFDPTQSVARYIQTVRRGSHARWAHLPDRPFVMAFAANWRSPEDGAAMADLLSHLFACEELSANVPAKVREDLVDCTRQFYNAMRGGNMMVAVPEQGAPPLEFIGTYVLEDAANGLALLRKIEQGSCHAAASFLPSGGYKTVTRTHRRGGLEYDEIRFDRKALDPRTLAVMSAMYGEDCLVRQAAVGDRVVYALGNQGVGDFVRLCRSAAPRMGLAQNASLRRLEGHLPREANMIMVLDLGRAFSLGSVFASITNADASPRIEFPVEGSKSGPFAGWAGVVRDNGFTGELWISADDLLRGVEIVKKLGAATASGKAPRD